MAVWPKRMVPNLSFGSGNRPIDQKGTFLIWGWYDILDRNPCCHVPYVAAQRRPASALTSKPQRNYVLALKRSALRCLKNDMMYTFDWIWEYIGRRLMKVNPRSKFKDNVMLFRVADLKNWIQLVQWIRIGKGLIIPTWSYVLRLEKMRSARPNWTTSCSTSNVETWWWYLQARVFYLQAAECAWIFFPKGWELKLRFVSAFLSSFILGMIGGKRLSKWSAWNFEMPMRWWKRLEKVPKGWPGVAGEPEPWVYQCFKTLQISVCRLAVMFLLIVLVLSLWNLFLASCIECRAQVNGIEEFIQQGLCYHKWIC